MIELLERVLEERLVQRECTQCTVHSGLLTVQVGTAALHAMGHWVIELQEVRVADADIDPVRAEGILVGRRATLVVLAGPTHDLTCEFSGGYLLRIRNDNPEFESWQLSERGQVLAVAGPGELWSLFESPRRFGMAGPPG